MKSEKWKMRMRMKNENENEKWEKSYELTKEIFF